MALKFELNVPMEVALMRVDPRYNEQYGTLMYSVRLPDGGEEKMFLPEEYGETIISKKIAVGEFFSVCKRKTVQKALYYEIRTIQRGPAAVEAPSKLESQLEASIHHVNAQRVQPPSKVTAPAAATFTHNRVETGQEVAPQDHGTELGNLLAGCMFAAIDAAVLARDYAHSKGITVQLSEQSIQDLTSTLMIHHQKMAELDRRYPGAGNSQPFSGNGNVRAWRQ